MQVKRLFHLSAVLSLAILLSLAHSEAVYAGDAVKSVWPTKTWLTSSPEQQGMDSSALAQLVAYGASNSFDSLLVVRHGRIVTEAYYAPYTADIPHEMFSSTKAVTSTLLGMVYKDGLLDRLDHPMLDFFANRRVENVDDRKKAITVQNLLDMTSGLDWDQGFEGGKQQSMWDLYRSSHWIQFILDRPMAHSPGEVFNYSNGSPDLISAIITTLTGKLAEDYAREKLFDPLGIVEWHWDRDPQGLTIGEGMLYLLPRDMAKIGYLYLRHGEWEGRRLLPPGWADVLNHRIVNMRASSDPNQSYSNFFWIFPDKRAYMANGKNGQLIVVFPDLDIVVVTTARKQMRYGALIDAVSAAVKSDSALPLNRGAADRLANVIKDVAVEKPTPVGPTSEIASAISGKIYKFPDNNLGIRSLTLFLDDSQPHIEFEVYAPAKYSGSYEVQIGLDGLYRKGSPILSDPNPGRITIAKGTWLDRQTFVIDSQDLGYGEQKKLVLTFNGKKLNAHRTVDGGDGLEGSVDGEQGD
ncbi:serine hydrolase domain-containing protein [Collimonas sp. NPDC087041]|uniref:serine hydrolase domain-containing protein n=1 Tax=Collimonas sp. NPDC087041 TaxID=3363960 RepID=UPI00381ED3EB